MINASSIGLYPHVHDRLDVDVESLRPGMVVADVIPNPPRTHFIKDAEARGCTIVDGLGMLVNQGVIGIKYWTGVDAGATVMRRKLKKFTAKSRGEKMSGGFGFGSDLRSFRKSAKSA